jgi:hypothetical protein
LATAFRVSLTRAAFRRTEVDAFASDLLPRVDPLRLEDFRLAVVRALAPAFDFFELFLREDIRGSLLPRSAMAEHPRGEAVRGLANGPRSEITRDPVISSKAQLEPRIEEPAESDSRVEKGSGIGATGNRQARR